MTIEEVIQILDPETALKGLLHSFNDKYCMPSQVLLEARQLAADELRKRQWISVKDRLPAVQGWTLTAFGDRSHSDNVLATDGTDIYFGYFITCDGFDAKKNKKNIIFVGVDVDISEDDYQEYNVTHWQPMPEPPKEGEENA